MDVDNIDAVDAHYRAHIGGEPQYMRFVDAPGTIGVLEWPKGSSRLRVHIYATLGLHVLIHGGNTAASPRPGVRMKSVGECLAFAPCAAGEALEALINPEGDYSFTAKMTLREYRAGRMKFDW